MATDAEKTAAAAADGAAARDQDINPWSVQGGVDENGEIVAINYEAISRWVLSACLPTPGGEVRKD